MCGVFRALVAGRVGNNAELDLDLERDALGASVCGRGGGGNASTKLGCDGEAFKVAWEMDDLGTSVCGRWRGCAPERGTMG